MSEVKQEFLEACQGAPPHPAASLSEEQAASLNQVGCRLCRQGQGHVHLVEKTPRRTRGVPEESQQRLAPKVLAERQAQMP